VYVNIR